MTGDTFLGKYMDLNGILMLLSAGRGLRVICFIVVVRWVVHCDGSVVVE